MGHARTGSNYLCKLIEESFKDVESQYELFNRKTCHLNETSKQKVCAHFKLDTEKLSDISHKDPIDFLNTIIELTDKSVFSHKVFPEHLDFSEALKIVDKSDFLFIVKRNFIDVYISKKRAIKMMESYDNPWVSIDTTGYKIDFDRDEYLQQEYIFNEWYIKLLEYIEKKNKLFSIIDYSHFHSLSVTNQQDLIKSELGRKIPKCYLSITDDVSLLNKQDKSLDYSTKINNYEEFMEFFIS